MFVLTALQASVEITVAATSVSLGKVAGLQPRFPPLVTVRLGGV
jgi:hypothetical protein